MTYSIFKEINKANELLEKEKRLINRLNYMEQGSYLISLKNYIQNKECNCSPKYNEIEVGDICFIDYGHAYVLEIGYQHFGIVMSKCSGKLFVAPIVSSKSNKLKKHCYLLKACGCLKWDSIIHLNDTKWINAARVIKKYVHVDTNSNEFKALEHEIIKTIMQGDSG